MMKIPYFPIDPAPTFLPYFLQVDIKKCLEVIVMIRSYTHHRCYIWALLVAFGAMLAPAYGGVSTPYYESFESDQGEWEGVLTTVPEAVVGSSSLSVDSTGELVLTDSPTNVVVHMIVKGTTTDTLPALDDTVAAAVCIHNGTIWLQDEAQAGGWLDTTQPVGVGTWIALTTHLNYTGPGVGSYNVYYALATQDGGLEEDLELIGGPIAFPTLYTGTSFSSLVVTQINATASLVDAVAIATLPSNRTVALEKTKLKVFKRPSGGGLFGVPPYSYAGDQRQVNENSQLGLDLGVGLNLSDRLDTLVAGAWENHTWTLDNNWTLGDLTEYTYEAAFQLIRASSVDTLALYPYDPLFDPGPPLFTIYGVNDVDYAGVTEVVPVPAYRTSSATLADVFGGDPVAGDRVLFPTEGGTYESAAYTGTEWNEAGGPARALNPGQVAVYLRQSGTFTRNN
jgi:hypothetical protein